MISGDFASWTGVLFEQLTIIDKDNLINRELSLVMSDISKIITPEVPAVSMSAEAVEAAIAEGNQELANAILAARHERRVRLAGKIATRIAAENERSVKLAQRKAYRENLVKIAAQNSKSVKVSSKAEKTTSKDGFVKVSELNNASKRAFASKAISQGFPKEYVDAILGESNPVVDNTVEIRNVMSSDLSENIKKSAVSSMVKVATLTDADYSRLIDYWKNELGYGDQEWIDALFTKMVS